MTDPQHKGGWTPGPWWWDEDVLFAARGSRVIDSIPCEGMWIDPNSANARLIAAAPELYGAAVLGLEVAESWIHDQLDGTSGLDSELARLEPIRSALAKASPDKSGGA